MTKQKIKGLIGATILVLALGAAGSYWWRAKECRDIAAASIPHQPSQIGKPAEFLQRVRADEQRIRAGSEATAALAELGQLYHANGFYAEASKCYQGLLRIDPSNPRWPHRLASILAGYGRLDDAATLWRRALALTDGYTPAQIRLADSDLKLNRTAEAVAIYSKVLARDPDNPYALLGMARIDMDAGRWAAARERLELAVARSDYSVGYDLLVTVCEQLGDTNRADTIRSQHKASGAFFDIPDPWLREMYFDCYDSYQLSVVGGTAAREGDVSTGLTLVERAVTYEPNNGYYHLQAAGLYKQSGNLNKARQHLETAIKVAPDLSDAWHNLFTLLTTLGQTQDAERVLAEGLSHCPDSAALHFARGRRLVDGGRLEEAIPDFKKAAAILNDDASPSFALASIYFKLERYDEAVAALKNALHAEADYPPALSTLAFYYITTADEPNARGSMQKVKDQPRILPPDRLRLEQAFQQQFGHTPY